jgi:alkylation response protein AidB-like acyl-CoA dehydrogenase
VRLSDSRAEAKFRSELVAWLDENGPAVDRASDPPRSPGHIPEWAKDWQRRLFDAGWLVPRWTPELGGRNASAIEQMIYLEELARRRVPRTVNSHGLDVVAPTLADQGAGVQVEQWLPATLHGEMSWCVAVDLVGMDATSDTADEGEQPVPPGVVVVEEDGSLVLRGSLPAPPGAADADRCLCGVDAPRGGKRVDDVAVVAVDLTAAGVVRPESAATSARADGSVPAAEGGSALAFDGVALGRDAVIGARDQGWSVLQSVRARLRSVRWITSLLSAQRALAALAEVGRARGLADDGVFRDTFARLQVEADAVRALAYRALARQSTGRPNPELAMLPLATARIEERVYLAGVDALGADGLDLGMDGPMGWPSGAWAQEWTGAMSDQVAVGGLGAERDRVAARVLGQHLR